MFVTGNAPSRYPTETFFGLLVPQGRGDMIEIPQRYPFMGEWGEILSTRIAEEENSALPVAIDMVWLSLVEKKFYSIESKINADAIDRLRREGDFSHIVVGMAPEGGVAVWLSGNKRCALADWLHAEEIDVEMSDFLPGSRFKSVEAYCDKYLSSMSLGDIAEDVVKGEYDKLMAQYSYRYLPIFDDWDADEGWMRTDKSGEAELASIADSLVDGAFDKRNDHSLLKYHNGGRPRRIAVKWREGKADFAAYLWFDDNAVRPVFDRFYGAHKDSKADLLLRIDSKNKKIGPALFRQGISQPVDLPDEAFQAIMFKNGFEYFRTANYRQPTGSWVW